MANFHFDQNLNRVVPNTEKNSAAGAPARSVTRFLVLRAGDIYFEGLPEELADSKDPYLKRFLV
jgi:hypothetical protein